MVATLLYALGAAASAGVLGALLGAAGAVFRRAAPAGTAWLLVAGAALAYALHELSLARLPRPQRRRQVPASWRVRHPPWRAALFYGLFLGPGVLTYVPVSTFYVVLLAALALGNPLGSTSVLAVYGAAQALGLLVAGWSVGSWEEASGAAHCTMERRGLLHGANGVVLAAAAAFLLVECAF